MRRKASLFMGALATATVLAIVPQGATAKTTAAGAPDKAAAIKMLKRLDLDKRRHTRRGAEKRPPRGARATKPALARAAAYFTDECAIHPIIDYLPNSTTKPYTWRQFQANGTWYGYEQFSRYGWRTEWPSGYDRPSIRTCSWALGYQYEWFRWTGRTWQWFATVNCDVSNRCWTVRSS